MDKAYIVANEQQEMAVLEKLEKYGARWGGGDLPTKFSPNPTIFGEDEKFPYALINRGIYVSWSNLFTLDNELEIVYDGRKEEQMSDKYVVSQEFMNELKEWKKRGNTEVYFVGSYYLSMLPDYVKRWWNYPEINNFECNNRLIAIIRWVNGEDVFEVEKPKKWVVRSKETDKYGYHIYVLLGALNSIQVAHPTDERTNATKFDTKEEAESWANSHQEVIEVEG